MIWYSSVGMMELWPQKDLVDKEKHFEIYSGLYGQPMERISQGEM